MKRKKSFLKWILPVLMGGIFLGCEGAVNSNDSQTPDSPAGGKASISGKVLYQDGVSDCSGIGVYLEKLESANRSLIIDNSAAAGRAAVPVFYAVTETAEDGSYEFNNLPDGSYTVYASNGEEAAFRTATVSEGSAVTVEDLKLVLKGSISGTLSVSGGEAAGSIVGVAGTSYIAFVDENGKFTISGIPAGKHKLCVKTGDKYETFSTEYEVTGKETVDIGEISVVVEEKSDSSKEVYVAVTGRGIEFSGSILSNVFYDNHNTTAKATITITEKASGIQMEQEWTKLPDNWYEWRLTYPFVEKDKEYDFNVRAWYKNTTFYNEDFTVKAAGGLGEFKIENPDECVPELTEDKVMQLKAEPEFTKNDKVTILRQGTTYTLNCGTFEESGWNYGNWAMAGDRWYDTSNGKFDLKEVHSVSGWKTYEKLNAQMSGMAYQVEAIIELKIAGYTYGDTVKFIMDTSSAYGEWGGKKAKLLVIFGVRSDNGEEHVEALTKDDFDELKNEAITFENMPGAANTFVNSEGEEVVYPYSYIVDYNSIIEEPTERVEILYNNEALSDYFFAGWDYSFPVSGQDLTYGTSGTVNGEKVFLANAVYAKIVTMFRR